MNIGIDTKIKRTRTKWWNATNATSKPKIKAKIVASYKPPGTKASQIDKKVTLVVAKISQATNR